MRIEKRALRYTLYALLALPGALLAADEGSATCSQDEWDEYFTEMQSHVISRWQPPYDYRPLSCTILLRLDFRGEVEHVEVIACDDDEEVRKSAENAAYEASPLPKPGNKACAVRQMAVRLTFNP